MRFMFGLRLSSVLHFFTVRLVGDRFLAWPATVKLHTEPVWREFMRASQFVNCVSGACARRYVVASSELRRQTASLG
jgi:hypothetical protein